MRVKNPYILLGTGLILGGIWLAPIAYILLESTPLSALGVSLIILGAICSVLGRTRPNVSPEVSSLILETGLENISVMVEELGLSSKAISGPHDILKPYFRRLRGILRVTHFINLNSSRLFLVQASLLDLGSAGRSSP